jgi:hypothetical protein
MLDRLTHEDFAGFVGDKFRLVPDAAAPLEVELIEATALPVRPLRLGEPSRRPPFSLVFRGPAAVVLPQCMYRLEHARLGVLDLFLVPIGQDPQGIHYEAVFN